MKIIGGGRLLTLWDELPYIENGAVAVDGESVLKTGDTNELRAEYPDAEFIDAHGGVIMPGLIDAHAHLYLSLARGLGGMFSPASCYEHHLRLQAYDRLLGLEACVRAAYAAMTDLIRSGVTTVIDMHASYRDPRGTLLILAGAAADLGVRASLGYAIRGCDGKDMLHSAIEENSEFIEYCSSRHDPLIRPAFCIDPLYTLDNDALTLCADKLGGRAPLHIAVCDGPDDNYYAKHTCGRSALGRLAEFGLLDKRTLLSHCSFLQKEDTEIIAESGASVALTPISDMIRTDISPDLALLRSSGVIVGLGSDGLTSDVLGLARALMLREAQQVTPRDAALILLKGNAKIASDIFGAELGAIKPGAPADIIIMDHEPHTRFDESDFHSHLLFGMSCGQCTFSMINGRVVMKDRKLLNVTDEFLGGKIRAASDALSKEYSAK